MSPKNTTTTTTLTLISSCLYTQQQTPVIAKILMWGLKVRARKWPFGTVSDGLMYNNVGKLILYVLGEGISGANNSGC